MTVNESTTVIGKSVTILGDLTGSEDLMMDGELEGTIRLSAARLTIGAAARVRGDVAALDIIVLGRLDGDIRATGRVQLRSTAIVQGSIYAGTLSIEEGATFRGEIDPSRAQEPVPEPSASRKVGGAVTPMPGRSSQLPAMLAAVAARGTQDIAEESRPSAAPANLFAETKA